MNQKSLLLTLFASAQIVFVFLYVYQYSTFITCQRNEQKKEHELVVLHEKKQQLTYQLSRAQDAEKIKTFAQKELGMTPIKLARVRNISCPSAKTGICDAQ